MMIRAEPAFKIKNANFPLFVFHVGTTDRDRLLKELAARIVQTPELFCNAPMVLGLAALAEEDIVLDFAGLLSGMQALGMRVAGVVGGSARQRLAAVEAGLGLFPEPRTSASEPLDAPVPAQPDSGQAAQLSGENMRPTMVIDKPVRTGQRIYAEGADLVVLAIVNAGAELIADGDIHIYAPLRGRAIAGAHGNQGARIFAQRLEAELISIAGFFQLFENGIPENVRGRPAQVHLDGSRLVMQPLSE